MSVGQILVALALFVVTLLGSLLVVGALLVSMPPTYFRKDHEPLLWTERHPMVRLLLHVLKNLLGVALIAGGLVLSLPGIPGQGILTMLIGVSLLDVPGKRRFERWWVSRPHVLGKINHWRRRFGRPPLVI